MKKITSVTFILLLISFSFSQNLKHKELSVGVLGGTSSTYFSNHTLGYSFGKINPQGTLFVRYLKSKSFGYGIELDGLVNRVAGNKTIFKTYLSNFLIQLHFNLTHISQGEQEHRTKHIFYKLGVGSSILSKSGFTDNNFSFLTSHGLQLEKTVGSFNLILNLTQQFNFSQGYYLDYKSKSTNPISVLYATQIGFSYVFVSKYYAKRIPMSTTY